MNEEDPMEGTMAKHLRKKHEEESGAGWVKPKPHPCHIIEVDCPTCSHDEWAEGCDGCSGTGRRRMAVFELVGKNIKYLDEFDEWEEDGVSYQIECLMDNCSPYKQGDTIPEGTLGEVELNKADDIAGLFVEYPQIWSKVGKWINHNGDTHLCTAFLIEEVE